MQQKNKPQRIIISVVKIIQKQKRREPRLLPTAEGASWHSWKYFYYTPVKIHETFINKVVIKIIGFVVIIGRNFFQSLLTNRVKQ